MNAGKFPFQKILIVDDTVANIKTLGAELKKDYKVTFATNGTDALEIAMSDNPPHLILLDVVMPGMDGFEVCKKLKKDKRTCDIPVIFITVMDDDEKKARGFEAGGVDYILKPFNLGTVKSIVQTHMNLLQYRDQLENISRFDPLTGLPNFIYFEQVLGSGWFSAADAESYLAIVLIDIDYFKEYNENYGPGAGDECLRAVSRVVKDSIESREDFVARYGGEKFSVMLFHCDKTGAGSFAERIRRKVEALNIVHEFSKISGCITVSAGGAVMIPRKDESVSTLLRLAEDALDRVKEEGRNRTKIIAI